MFYSLWGKTISIFSASCSVFVDLVFFRVWYKCSRITINLSMRPGHLAKFPFFIALIKVDFTGLKHVACKKLANSAWVYFRKHCSLGNFCCHSLAHLHSRLIVVNTIVYYVVFSTLVRLFTLCRKQGYLLS